MSDERIGLKDACIGCASWAPHLNHKSICVLSAKALNLSICIFQIFTPCSMHEFFFTFLVVLIPFLVAVSTQLLFIFDGNA